jgi:nitrite reductase/ring-hydroxylating ferredoxin subunit
MDVANTDFTLAGSLEELKAKGRLVVHGAHRPILVVYDRGRVFALDNRCPHMGFPLDRAVSRTEISPATGTTPASTSKAAAPSVYGRTIQS